MPLQLGNDDLNLALVITAKDKSGRVVGKVKQDIKATGNEAETAGRKLGGMERSMSGLLKAAGAYISLRAGQRLLQEADAYRRAKSRGQAANSHGHTKTSCVPPPRL